MSAPDRRAMVERPGKDLSVRRQCVLLSLTRSGVYRSKPVAGADDLAVMRRIDELHLELPFYGSRRMTFELNKEGRGVNRKRVRRLMRVMGIEALVPRPGTSKAAPGHKDRTERKGCRFDPGDDRAEPNRPGASKDCTRRFAGPTGQPAGARSPVRRHRLGLHRRRTEFCDHQRHRRDVSGAGRHPGTSRPERRREAARRGFALRQGAA